MKYGFPVRGRQLSHIHFAPVLRLANHGKPRQGTEIETNKNVLFHNFVDRLPARGRKEHYIDSLYFFIF